MIDPESKSQADLKGLLKTLRRTTSLSEEKKVINSFPRLYEEHCKFGMIREPKILALKRFKRFFYDNTQCEQDIINRVEPTGALKDYSGTLCKVKLEGNCLCHDERHGSWIRSGSVSFGGGSSPARSVDTRRVCTHQLCRSL
jgi:hypothetical protein